MQTKRKRTIPAVAVAVLAVLSAAGCGRQPDRDAAAGHDAPHTAEHDEHGPEHGHEEHAGEDGVVELAPEAIERIGLVTEPAARRPLAGRWATTGKIGFDEERLAHVTPRVGGRLARVPAALGETVSAGEVLAVVDSVELGEAKAAFLRARAREEVARRRLEREEELREDRISSEQEVLEAEGAAREAAADLAASRETLRLLGLGSGAVDGLDWGADEPSLIPVRSPFGGRIVAREATVGENVSPEDTLFTLADLSEVWLWIDLYERDLARVEPGEPVRVRFDAFPEETFTGELAYIADQLDPESRTVRARVDLANPGARLKPGMFARVSFAADGAGAPPVLAVPRGAVQRDGDASIVFVRTGARTGAPTGRGRFERREVRVGRVTDELVEILGGLSPGDEVVTEGAFLLRSQASADELGGHHH